MERTRKILICMKENNKHWDDTDDKLSEKDIKVVIVKKKKDRPLKWIERD